ncbi:synaptobrevin, longin-like domain protein [Tanacetum coccineum]
MIPYSNLFVTATANTLADGTLELHATIDTIVYIITKASIRNRLQLADASGITMLPNNEIFEGMGNMGYPTDGSFTFWKSFFTPQWRFLVHHILHCISSKSGGWDQFGSNIATALICLSTGRVVCAKVCEGDKRIVRIKEGDCAGRHVVIVDDLVQSEGTLIGCQKVLVAHGATKVSAYVTHAMFPINQERDLFTQIVEVNKARASDEEIEEPIKDQPLPTDASPTALSQTTLLTLIQRRMRRTPRRILLTINTANGGDNDNNESSDDDDNDDDV